MSFKEIKSNTQAQKGFTIVELLIVVVVIAILAAITIVSYNGITNRANASAAASTASTVQKKAELYLNDDSTTTGYPLTLSALTNTANSSKAYFIGGGVNVTAGVDPTSGNGKNTIRLDVCGLPAGTTNGSSKTSATGLKITYYTFDSPTTKQILVGDTTANCAPVSS